MLAAASSVAAATLPTGFAETRIASGIASPTAMALAPDGRIFVCEQGGRLRVIKNGVLLPAPFLTLAVNSSGERGLLGVTFDPAFASNGFVYVYYTATTPTIHNRVSRFTAAGDVVASGSGKVLLDLNPLSAATNHNGGALHFGRDGKLYVAVGENANSSNAQTLDNLLGKLLRINPDGTIPPDNPFYGTAIGVNRAIWALGLRNPYTFAFHRSTGRMLVNDVGQYTWEEINDGIRGSNYGWPATEGLTSDPRFRAPLYAYGHGNGSTTGCAITGAAFYDPPTGQFPPAYANKFFFADFCSGWIRRFDPVNRTVTGFATGIAAPVDLRVAIRWQPLLSGPQRRGGLPGPLHGEPGAHHHDASRQRHRHRRRDRDLRRHRVGHGAAHVPVAAQRRQHHGRGLADVHPGLGDPGRRRRPLPRPRLERLRKRHQQRSDPPRDAEHEPHRDHHRPRAPNALQRRRQDQLLRDRNRFREWKPAPKRLHLVGRFPPRHPFPPLRAAHERGQDRLLRHPDHG